MTFPNENKLKSMRDKLNETEPTHTLPENATTAQRVKYKICEKFVTYILDHNISQAELARRLEVDRARVNEIVKYKIDLFTIDKLVELAEKLDPNFDIKVA